MTDILRHSRQDLLIESLETINLLLSSKNLSHSTLTILFHLCLQSSLTIALRNGNNIMTWKENQRKKWLEGFEKGNSKSLFPQLDKFLSLYKSLFGKNEDTDDYKMAERLHSLRNKFVHINFDTHSTQVSMLWECYSFSTRKMLECVESSKGIFFYEQGEKSQFDSLIASIDESLTNLTIEVDS